MEKRCRTRGGVIGVNVANGNFRHQLSNCFLTLTIENKELNF